MILAGDIGGTKADLCLFTEIATRKIAKEQRFFSQEHSSLEEIVEKFLQGANTPIKGACFGIAGPVENGICRATNLPWVVEVQKLAKLSRTEKTFLINDLEANAWGIPLLQSEEFYTLSSGLGGVEGNRALISAGTGLGEAGIYFDGKEHHPFACEGGHCSFAPCDEEEVEIWRYLQKKFGTVSCERLLSGAGFSHLYNFFLEVKGLQELAEVRDLMRQQDPAKVISEYGFSRKCNICVKVLDKFSSIYGSEAGNVALKFFATGGVYIGGGIAPKILDSLKEGKFMEAFLGKGRLSNFLKTIKVQVILNSKTALLGAADYAGRNCI